MTVTLGLAGYGEAYFDDLRIEPLVALPGTPSARESLADADGDPPGTPAIAPPTPGASSASAC